MKVCGARIIVDMYLRDHERSGRVPVALSELVGNSSLEPWLNPFN